MYSIQAGFLTDEGRKKLQDSRHPALDMNARTSENEPAQSEVVVTKTA
jgi:hypothetical protein